MKGQNEVSLFRFSILTLQVSFADRSKVVLLLWILFCHSCFIFIFVVLACLFLAVLWSPAGKGLTSWLSCVWCMYSCVFVTFPNGFLGQVWYLTVSILDLCLPNYFVGFFFSGIMEYHRSVKICEVIVIKGYKYSHCKSYGQD